MRSNILIVTGLSILLSAGLYAQGGYGNMGSGMMNDSDDNNQQETQYNRTMGNMMNNNYGMMGGNYGHGMMGGNYGHGMMGGNYGHGMMGGNYGHSMMGGNYGHGMMGGNYGHGMMGGNYGHGMMGGNYGHGMMGGNYGHGMMYDNMMGGNHHFGYNSGMMNMFYGLNLTQEQMKQISKIQMNMYKNIQRPDAAFTKDSFDKDKFIKIMNDRKNDMIKSKAEMIAKVYKLLTPKQKEALKNTMNFIHGIK